MHFASLLQSVVPAILLAEAVNAAPVKDATLLSRAPHGEYYTDDQGGEVSYSTSGSAWTHKTGTCKDYNTTSSFNNDASAEYSFTYDGQDIFFAIYGSKKYDRGLFDVYLNDEKIGQGDAYDDSLNAAGSMPSIELFRYNNFSETGHANIIHVKNVKDSRISTENGYPYLFLDFILSAS